MTKIKFGFLLIMLAFASENQENKVESAKSEEKCEEKNAEDLILVKIEEDEYTKTNQKTSQYIGVSYNESKARWTVRRWSKKDKKIVYNGFYKDEETAAHASDTFARKLMANGEQKHRLNFPDDDTEVFPEKKETSSKFIGVSYNKMDKKWHAQRHSKDDNKHFFNGSYKDEETAARSSDTLARNLMADGKHNYKLNFPDDVTEVLPDEKETLSKFFGVSYNKKRKKWSAQRRSKNEKKMLYNGTYKDEETAAHASDTLARKLMANGKQNHKLNFPDDKSENQKNKRKRSENEDMENYQNK